MHPETGRVRKWEGICLIKGPHPATHARLSGSLTGTLLPGFHVLDLVVDFVDDLVVRLQLEKGYWKW